MSTTEQLITLSDGEQVTIHGLKRRVKRSKSFARRPEFQDVATLLTDNAVRIYVLSRHSTEWCASPAATNPEVAAIITATPPKPEPMPTKELKSRKSANKARRDVTNHINAERELEECDELFREMKDNGELSPCNATEDDVCALNAPVEAVTTQSAVSTQPIGETALEVAISGAKTIVVALQAGEQLTDGFLVKNATRILDTLKNETKGLDIFAQAEIMAEPLGMLRFIAMRTKSDNGKRLTYRLNSEYRRFEVALT